MISKSFWSDEIKFEPGPLWQKNSSISPQAKCYGGKLIFCTNVNTDSQSEVWWGGIMLRDAFYSSGKEEVARADWKK